MVFNIHVVYKTPSEERLFLGNGWGSVRDVVGPYLSAAAADIVIDNWALSQKVPSTMNLTLSLSNRCEVDKVFVSVRANSVFGSAQKLLKRGERTILTLSGIYADQDRDYTVLVLQSTFGTHSKIAESPGTCDIVAINELQLTR